MPFIRAKKGLTGAKIKGNKIPDDMTLVDTDGAIKDSEIIDNSTWGTRARKKIKDWYEKPVGIVFLLVVGGLIVSVISSFL